MPDIPSLPSEELVKRLQRGGAQFVRQGAADHAIYLRIVDGIRYSSPVQMGKKTFDPIIANECSGN